MRLETRLLVIIGTVLLGSFALQSVDYYRTGRDQAIEDLRDQAEAIRNTLMATRRVYHHQFIESGIELTAKTVGFLPAHALSRIAKDFPNWDNSGIRFNNVSDKPRNPNQKADAAEMKAIEHFRQNSKQEVLFTPYQEGEKPFYLYARPIWIEEYCLSCHGSRENAPPAIREMYATSYDYQIGELRGILSIKLPAAHIEAMARKHFLQSVPTAMGILLLCFGAIAWAVRHYVRNPLARVVEGIKTVETGSFSHHIENMNGEFATIANSFNSMIDRLGANRHELRQLWESVEQSPVSVVITDKSGAIVYVNRKFEQISGYSREEALGANPRILKSNYTAPAEYQKLWETISEGGIWQGEFRNKRKDGSVYWEFAIIAPIRDESGEIVRFLALKEDISARKRAEQDLGAAREELERIAYASAHDLQEPLRMVSTYVQLIARRFKDKLDPEDQSYVNFAVEGANRIHHQLNDLLSYMEVDRHPLRMDEIDANALFHRVLGGLETAIEATGASITADPLPHIRADERLIGIVIHQLLNNALKYRSAAAPIIHVAAKKDGDEWVFSVEDNGIGFEMAYANRLFSLFSRLHLRDQYPGSGIGLAMCRKVVDYHGGRIWARSEPDKGSIFYFTMPTR
jgi:PAS domain S-box-containing protein